jgi:hypothetical protein
VPQQARLHTIQLQVGRAGKIIYNNLKTCLVPPTMLQTISNMDSAPAA